MRDLVGRPWPRALLGIAAGSVCMFTATSPALAQDTAPPTVSGAFATAPQGNNNWRLTAPQTLNLSGTDDVGVSKFQYSLDGGATYIDVPATANTASVPLSTEGNTTLRYRAVDAAGNSSRGATTNTTLSAASAAGDAGVRLASMTGRSVGDILVIDTGEGQETRTIATIPSPAPAAPAPNVTLSAPLTERARVGRRRGGHRHVQHDRPADRHQRPGRDLGHVGHDHAGRGDRRGHRGPAHEPHEPRRRRDAAARSGRQLGDCEDREHHHARARRSGAQRHADQRADQEPHHRRPGLRPADRRRQDPPVADAHPAAHRSALARRDRHRLQRRRRRRDPAHDARRRVHRPQDG